MAYRSLLVVLCLLAGFALSAKAEEEVRVADSGLFDRLDSNGDGLLAAEELPADQARLFARLVRLGDSDNDGKLAKREWDTATTPRRPAKPLEEKASGELPGADAARLLLLKLDTNQDGKLVEKEIPESLADVYTQIAGQFDNNGNGQLDSLELARSGPQLSRLAQRIARQRNWDVESELAKFDRQQGEASQRFSEPLTRQRMLRDPSQQLALFEEYDGNQDGKLVLDEVPEAARERFERLIRFGDRDRDGALSKGEFETAANRTLRSMRSMSRTNAE
ncbi:hypothetical protein [Aeoliella mucimassa]|nr:hypothetical protein [Aeoliella mucimassa]